MNKTTLYNLVMVVDDHDVSNFIAQYVLINSGISEQNIIKPSGFSALTYLRENIDNPALIPDIIFLDLDMPVIDGQTFIQEFLKLPSQVSQTTKIVILSAHDRREQLWHLYQKGIIKHFLIKPLSQKTLEEFKQKIENES